MRGRLVILYGSQTGTAEDLAVLISYEAKRLLFECVLSSMDDFGAASILKEKFILFIAATSGQGDAPDNMSVFWRFLRRRALPSDSLNGLRFGVIGLGDSSYAKFNFVGKRLQRRLLQLGAESLVSSPALGDEQHDLGADAVVDPWLEQFFHAMCEACPLSDSEQPLPRNCLPPVRHSIGVVSDHDVAEPRLSADADSFPARLERNHRVTCESHFQDVRLLHFFCSDIDRHISYEPGDVAVISPANLSEDVGEFMSLVSGPSEGSLISINQGPLASRIASPCSLEWLVRHVLDIHSIPRRSFFMLLAHFAASDLEREKFSELGASEGQQDRYDYCNRARRTIVEVLADFPETAKRIPLEYLLEMIPAIRPRYFSIASSSRVCENGLELLVAVVKYKSKMIASRVGLCSTWLSRLQPGETINIKIKRGTIRFPPQVSNTPVIMVGPGTGVAPFKSYIDDQLSRYCSDQLQTTLRPLVLFFGCRSRLADFHFGDHFAELQRKGQLELFTAFSRDQPEKRYVQHVMREQSALLWRLVGKQGAALYVAGNSRDMPDQVRSALVEAISTHGQCDGDDFVQQMEKNGLFQMETWS